ncbi:tryptophan halogenase [Sphingomonas sp. BE138]|uniref:tryptophan halogenase family protein n=1 Tax=Sphingomonas sp. BE138 TaxID=2817845 RepID=UPI002855190C|nr:tryptophan 7-halogenase [Sphingomonas sp. BE138]MDR6787047.1 tryptophan halogenase [Sphingomonas sp. BE138]
MAENVCAAPGAIGSILIVGGGTAGWMTAAALARSLGPRRPSITLVESEELGTVGVGEATIPPILEMNRLLGIDEDAFVRATGATFKLGISFENWRAVGHAYFHPFGRIGAAIGPLPFHLYWRALASADPATAGALTDYSLPAMAARAGTFCRPSDDPRNTLSTISYAFHFDATRYARLLRARAEADGVVRHEGRVVAATREAGDHPAGPMVRAVTLADGRVLEADLFIDCSGFSGLLIGDARDNPYRDWRHWLPCDSALAMPIARATDPLPYTRSIAGTAGWQWRIPLQHRTGAGHVFASDFIDADRAEQALRAAVEGAPLADPKLLRFTPGRRTQAWRGNVVAIGLAAGFLEPLESTSIHLIQSAITRLLALFPDRAFASADIAYYNRATAAEFDRIRDFLILHYHATGRRDSAFWDHVRTMAIPDTLAERIDLFRSRGRFFPEAFDLFLEPSWVAVLDGQGITPASPDPLALAAVDTLADVLPRMRAAVARAAAAMPRHGDFLARHAAAPVT